MRATLYILEIFPVSHAKVWVLLVISANKRVLTLASSDIFIEVYTGEQCACLAAEYTQAEDNWVFSSQDPQMTDSYIHQVNIVILWKYNNWDIDYMDYMS